MSAGPPAGHHAEIGLDLHFEADLSEEQVQSEARFLASVPARTGKRDPLAMLFGLALDIAACVESDGSITTLFVIPVRVEDGPDALLDALLRHVPVLGAELIYAWANGFTHVLLSTAANASNSFHASRARGEVSNHELIELRPEATRQLRKILG